MIKMRYYPDYVFNKNEDITRRNMIEYDRKRDAEREILRQNYPEYDKMSMIEQAALREELFEPDSTFARRLLKKMKERVWQNDYQRTNHERGTYNPEHD